MRSEQRIAVSIHVRRTIGRLCGPGQRINHRLGPYHWNCRPCRLNQDKISGWKDRGDHRNPDRGCGPPGKKKPAGTKAPWKGSASLSHRIDAWRGKHFTLHHQFHIKMTEEMVVDLDPDEIAKLGGILEKILKRIWNLKFSDEKQNRWFLKWATSRLIEDIELTVDKVWFMRGGNSRHIGYDENWSIWTSPHIAV